MSIDNLMAENDRLKATNSVLREKLEQQSCLTCDIITPEVVAKLQAEVAALKRMLTESERCMRAFSAHYQAATETDQVSAMILRDMWLKFQARVADIRTRIQKALQ